MLARKLFTVCSFGFTLVCHGELVQNENLSEVKPNRPNLSDAQVSAQMKANSEVRSNQLRCWQRGTLVFAENNVHLMEPSRARFVKEGKRDLHLYDYGEALCVYWGG